MNTYKILVIDQDAAVIKPLQEDWAVTVVNACAGDALGVLQTEAPDLLILDYSEENSQLLRQIRDAHPALKIITLGKGATTADAVKALKLGSVEFVAKAIDSPDLKAIIWSLLEEEKQRECVVTHPWFYGRGPALQQLFTDILKLGRRESLILLGESGTGKRRVAEIINNTFAPKYKKLVSINLALFPEDQRETYFWSTLRNLSQKYESEVQGVEETFYDTLYLQGLSSCSADFLDTLTSLLKDRSSDGMIGSSLRVIIGLDSETDQTCLQKSLSDFSVISVPPLRSRKEDIPEMIKAVVAKYNRKHARRVDGIDFEVLNIFLNYSWPGNSKELDSILETMVLSCQNKTVLRLDEVPLTLQMLEDNVYKFGYNSVLPLQEAREIFEKKLIEFTSGKFGMEKAASFLKIHSPLLGVKQ